MASKLIELRYGGICKISYYGKGDFRDAACNEYRRLKYKPNQTEQDKLAFDEHSQRKQRRVFRLDSILLISTDTVDLNNISNSWGLSGDDLDKINKEIAVLKKRVEKTHQTLNDFMEGEDLPF